MTSQSCMPAGSAIRPPSHSDLQSTRTTKYRDGQILGERREIRKEKVKKKRVVEQVVEKQYTYGEVEKIEEEVMEEVARPVREITVQKVNQIIKTVEVPEIEYVEKIVECPEVQIVEREVEVPTIKEIERIVEVPRIEVVERIEEYRVVEEKYVDEVKEVPYIVEEVVEKEVMVPKPVYVDVPTEEVIDVLECQEIILNFPVPVLETVNCELIMPKVIAKYRQRDTYFYYPRFVEVPIPVDLLDDSTIEACESILMRVDAIRQVMSENTFSGNMDQPKAERRSGISSRPSIIKSSGSSSESNSRVRVNHSLARLALDSPEATCGREADRPSSVSIASPAQEDRVTGTPETRRCCSKRESFQTCSHDPSFHGDDGSCTRCHHSYTDWEDDNDSDSSSLADPPDEAVISIRGSASSLSVLGTQR